MLLSQNEWVAEGPLRVCEVADGVHILLYHHSAKSSLDDGLASVRFPRDYGVEVEQTLEGFIRLPVRKRLREFHEMNRDLSLVLAGPLDRQPIPTLLVLIYSNRRLAKRCGVLRKKRFSFGEGFGSVPCLSK